MISGFSVPSLNLPKKNDDKTPKGSFYEKISQAKIEKDKYEDLRNKINDLNAKFEKQNTDAYKQQLDTLQKVDKKLSELNIKYDSLLDEVNQTHVTLEEMQNEQSKLCTKAELAKNLEDISNCIQDYIMNTPRTENTRELYDKLEALEQKLKDVETRVPVINFEKKDVVGEVVFKRPEKKSKDSH